MQSCRDQFERAGRVWLHRITPDEAPAWMQPGERAAVQANQVKARSRTISNAIDDRDGEHVWIETDHDGTRERHVFASVDFSTTRPNRGNPPRQCEELTALDAIVYLDLLLQHGIVTRGCSRRDGDDAWKLRDGERAQPKSTTGRKRIAHGDRKRQADITDLARRIYAEDGGTRWSQGAKAPHDLNEERTIELHARAAVRLFTKSAGAE